MIMLMKTSYSFIPGFLLILNSLISAQDIKLQNGNQLKTVKAGTFIDLTMTYPGMEPCNGRCNGARGQLISYVDGVVKLKVHQSIEPLMDKNKKVGNLSKAYSNSDYPVISIPKDDILSITKKGNKRIKKFTPMQSVGMTLTLLGAANLVSGIEVRDYGKDASNTLLGVGITELVFGIILVSSFDQKTYITSLNCPLKRNNGKIWVLK